MPFCNVCNEHYFSWEEDRHKCSPRWKVWEPNSGEDAANSSTIRAADAEAAAERWASEYDNDGDYTIIGGTDVTVCVLAEKVYLDHEEQIDEQTGALPAEAQASVVQYEVSGETVAEYHAREVKP